MAELVIILSLFCSLPLLGIPAIFYGFILFFLLFSIDGDSDSISDCRGFSPSITSELLTPVSNTNNGKPISISNGSSSMTNSFGQQQQQQQSNLNGTSNSSHHSKISSSMSTSATSTCSRSSIGSSQQNGISSSNGSTSAGSSSSNSHSSGASSKVNQQQLLNNHPTNPEVTVTSTSNKSCDMLNEGKEVVMNGGGAGCTSGVVAGASGTSTATVNGTGAGGQGSPLRSQLGLKLKSHKPIAATSVKPSPLQCLLCPYTTENPTVLEEHINRSHFDPLSPSINNGASGNSHVDTLSALQCPICARTFESGSDLELHVNIEHRDILSPAKADRQTGGTPAAASVNGSLTGSLCPVCGISFDHMKTADMEIHIEKHFSKSPQNPASKEPDLEKQAQKLREQREFEMLRAQYGMDDQGNFREQSAAAMQRAVYAGEMSVADYYERQVGLRAAESHGVDDGSSCTKSVSPRVLALSTSSPNVLKTYVCSSVDHYASSYGDKGWGCGYRNLQMMLSSLLQVSGSFFNRFVSFYRKCILKKANILITPNVPLLQKYIHYVICGNETVEQLSDESTFLSYTFIPSNRTPPTTKPYTRRGDRTVRRALQCPASPDCSVWLKLPGRKDSTFRVQSSWAASCTTPESGLVLRKSLPSCHGSGSAASWWTSIGQRRPMDVTRNCSTGCCVTSRNPGSTRHLCTCNIKVRF